MRAWPVEAKRREFEHKLASVTDEFAWWRDESTRKPLLKHHTQIRAVTARLQALVDLVARDLSDLKDSDDRFLEAWPSIQGDILEIHRIWEYFRSKLALRFVPRFGPALALADEFAWECYRPAREAVARATPPGAALKEPPLVFFNGGWSPFAAGRGVKFAAEAVPGEALVREATQEVIRGLPIPMIGLPWYQIAHLPDAVVIGHEVGHCVEEDFGLTATILHLIEVALPGVPQGHSTAWREWAGEVFGDVYGILASGPAYVGALMDFLARDVLTVQADDQRLSGWRPHPPEGLRIEIAVSALRKLSFEGDADRLEKQWTGRFGAHPYTDFSREVPAVVRSLLKGPYPELAGFGLSEVIKFTALDQISADAMATTLLERLSPTGEGVRPLVAAARLAFGRDPVGYARPGSDEKRAGDRIIDRVVSLQTDEVRGISNELQSAPFAVDVEGGKALRDQIHRLRREQPT